MGSLLIAWMLLLAPPIPSDAGAAPLPLVGSIELNAEALLAAPSLLASDALALTVEVSRQADFKLSEGGEVLTAGRLFQGRNPLRFARPGLSGRSQTLAFLLELLEDGGITRRAFRVVVSVDGGADTGPQARVERSGFFSLEMYHAGRLIGFRKKTMTELLKLRTGLVAPVPDPGVSGSAIRSRPTSHSVSLVDLGMALAKYLGRKKAEKRLKAYNVEALKTKLTATILRDRREVPVTIELRID